MNAYDLGVQQALIDAGLTKEAASWMWPAAAAGASLLGAGIGALSSEDKKRGALIGALGGLGLIGGARYGTGRLTKLLQVTSRPGAKSLQQVLQNPAARRWVNKRLGAGAVLGLGGLGAGIGLGSRYVPPFETPNRGGGGLFGLLSPENMPQLSGLLSLLPIARRMEAATGQGGTLFGLTPTDLSTPPGTYSTELEPGTYSMEPEARSYV